jgi:hypothetical protein
MFINSDDLIALSICEDVIQGAARVKKAKWGVLLRASDSKVLHASRRFVPTASPVQVNKEIAAKLVEGFAIIGSAKFHPPDNKLQVSYKAKQLGKSTTYRFSIERHGGGSHLSRTAGSLRLDRERCRHSHGRDPSARNRLRSLRHR